MSAKMKDRRRQGCVRATLREYFDKMPRLSRSSGSNHGDGNIFSYGGRQLAVKAKSGAIAVHGSQQDLASAARFRFARPSQRFLARGTSAASDPDLGFTDGLRSAPGVNRDNHCLRAK